MAEETITRDELVAQLDRMQRSHLINVGDVGDFAGEVFEGIERSREPAYEPGGVYRDAHGDTFKYCNKLAGDTPWLGFTGELYAHSHVAQPLTRLVPEGSLPDRAERAEQKLAEIEAACRNSGLLMPGTATTWVVTADRILAIIVGDQAPPLTAVCTGPDCGEQFTDSETGEYEFTSRERMEKLLDADGWTAGPVLCPACQEEGP